MAKNWILENKCASLDELKKAEKTIRKEVDKVVEVVREDED